MNLKFNSAKPMRSHGYAWKAFNRLAERLQFGSHFGQGLLKSAGGERGHILTTWERSTTEAALSLEDKS